MPEPERSKTLTAVLDSFVKREEAGLIKYGTNVDRDDLTPEEWVKHHEEELMDAILYNRRMFHELLAHKRAADELIQSLDKIKAAKFDQPFQVEYAIREALFKHKVDLALYKTRIDG